ncbi:MAG TPA: hypothetical protein PK760_12565 [Flavobacteriales bacterium]|nr:hypothetical protein [Flavobacteriales bacterium]
MAARTALLAQHLHEPYAIELITLRFNALLEIIGGFFSAEERAQVYATGSVAWGFSEILGACLLDHGMELKAVERDPLQGLVAWHRQR